MSTSSIALASPDPVDPREFVDACAAAAVFLTTDARPAPLEVVLLADSADPLSCHISIAAVPLGAGWQWAVTITSPNKTPVATVLSHHQGHARPHLSYLNTALADRLPAVLERLERLTLPEVA